MKRTYHIGLVAGPNEYEDVPEGTLLLQARRDVDYLSCELWKYLGERETTKAELRRNAVAILDQVNRQEGTAYTRLVVD